jgi:hypothetical protein
MLIICLFLRLAFDANRKTLQLSDSSQHSFNKYLIRADGFHKNDEGPLDWFIHLLFFLAFVKEEERTSKPVFRSVLVK